MKNSRLCGLVNTIAIFYNIQNEYYKK